MRWRNAPDATERAKSRATNLPPTSQLLIYCLLRSPAKMGENTKCIKVGLAAGSSHMAEEQRPKPFQNLSSGALSIASIVTAPMMLTILVKL